MLPASNRGAGQSVGFPDVCNTPSPAGAPLPIPYVNIALNAMAVGFSLAVKLSGMNALTMSTKIPLTGGDEGGSLHSTIKGQATYVSGCPNVKVDGMPAVTLTSPTTANKMNNPLGSVMVSSLVNVFFSHAGSLAAETAASPADRRGRPLFAEDLAALGDAVNGGAGPPPTRSTMLAQSVGYLQISRFTSDLATRIHNEMRSLDALGMSALVIDLRGNPGGDVEAFRAVAEDFLKPGAVLARAIDGEGDEVVYRSHGRNACSIPLVVLIDRGTASAAELLAGCLQSHGRAKLVGEATYGKGCAQRVVPSAAGSASYATVVAYRLPDGRDIQGVGVRPDIEVPRAIDAGEGAGDAALETAIQMILRGEA